MPRRYAYQVITNGAERWCRHYITRKAKLDANGDPVKDVSGESDGFVS
jgi:hypothetical protein